MVTRARVALALVALFVVAPLGAAVVMSALLLLGVEPHTVFLPGFVVKSGLEALGLHVHNRVAVLSTAVVWWLIIVSMWLVLRRFLRRTA